MPSDPRMYEFTSAVVDDKEHVQCSKPDRVNREQITRPDFERMIRTIRREYLDHAPFWSARDLERKLLSFKDYYNDQRTHHALGGVAPRAKFGKTRLTVVNLDNYRWRSHCRGLYHLRPSPLER